MMHQINRAMKSSIAESGSRPSGSLRRQAARFLFVLLSMQRAQSVLAAPVMSIEQPAGTPLNTRFVAWA